MAKKSTAQIWLEYAVARTIFGVFATLPRKASIGLGKLLARIGYRFLGNLRRTGKRNLEIAFPEKSLAEREKILKASFENLGRILGDVSQFPRFTPKRLEELVEFNLEGENYEYYLAEKAKGRGTIILSPHLGNWEMIVFAYSAIQEPISYLARPLDNPLIEDLTVRLRTRFGNRPLNKTNSVMKAIEILRHGEILGVLPDVNSHPKEGVFVPLFGKLACTTSGVAMLALRTNAMIAPICGVWDEESQRYKFIKGEIIEPVRTGNRQQDLIETTARYTAALEKFIRAYPEQWLWIHKRWKTRPPGEPSLY
jgi:KDO2-lipid IV(A) lauroyltransferase